MQILSFATDQSRVIETYGSRAAAGLNLAHFSGPASLVLIQLQANGLLGPHPAAQDQLFIITAGQGEVSAAGSDFQSVATGQAVLWRRGETHATRTAEGLTALVLEAAEISLDG